ncbi:hypothetical protein QNH48_14640 [Neobacillus sp. YX16]|uniref:hypothetical protein n=1 Tax=Neobacillus sp. YX16 TaxID=3047874 RepID=UPI0024C29080|nr:hypothetical protein [Neobacillus sp. YX16]WHZ05780.1 hypothetical protein QNH48_14640 [Neobacillus sp. YX16]
MDHTLKVLKWAKEMSNETEIVKMFWDELVTKLGLNKSATAEEILDEIRLFGSSSLFWLTDIHRNVILGHRENVNRIKSQD